MFPSVQEFMTFTSQLIVERSEKGSRASVKEQGKRRHPALAWPPHLRPPTAPRTPCGLVKERAARMHAASLISLPSSSFPCLHKILWPLLASGCWLKSPPKLGRSRRPLLQSVGISKRDFLPPCPGTAAFCAPKILTRRRMLSRQVREL